jgi:DNA-binding GntR family transcriptional regulator
MMTEDMGRGGDASSSVVVSLYEQLKQMAINFSLQPGEKINEVEIAKRFKVSRTPLREALNRLAMEGFLRFEPGKGYCCRDLNVQDMFDLYELRQCLEVSAGRLAAERASDADIATLELMLDQHAVIAGDVAARIEWEERFHIGIAALSRNRELVRVLTNVNERIRFIRGVDLERLDPIASNQGEHRLMIDALRRHSGDDLEAVLKQHISRGFDQVMDLTRHGFGKIYTQQFAAPVWASPTAP